MADAIPDNPAALLREQQLVAAFKAKGYPIEGPTLRTWRVRGGGPPFQRFGRWVVYPWGLADTWAKERLGGLLSSTST
jgi:hypothetical protein